MDYRGYRGETQDTKWLLDLFEGTVLLFVGVLVTFCREFSAAIRALVSD